MNTYLLDLRKKIKARDDYLADFTRVLKNSNRMGVLSSLLCLFVGLFCVIVGIQTVKLFALEPIIGVVLLLPFLFLVAVPFATLTTGLDKNIMYSPMDFFGSYDSSSFLLSRFWKKEKKLSIFNSHKDASAFFEDCEPLDEGIAVNTLNAVYGLSLEGTDLFKECFVYYEELGYWPKFLLKMSAEIDRLNLSARKSDNSSNLAKLTSSIVKIEAKSRKARLHVVK